MSTPFNVETLLMHPIPMHNDTDEDDNAVQKNGGDDDSDEGANVL